jgi:hypothetical protein
LAGQQGWLVAVQVAVVDSRLSRAPAMPMTASPDMRAGRRHPSLARERFNRPLQSPGAMRITDHAISLLLEAGLTKPDAVAAFKALLVQTLGAAALAASESRPEVRRHASDRHAAVPADDLPAMAAVADELTAALGGDQAFVFGLLALLDAIEQAGRRHA